jgi:cold shock CspA family protein
MPFTGTLRTWHDDRGFGFIAPAHGGAEVFVHFSAFPRDGSRPTQGEQLRYELGRGKNGEVQAVGVTRLSRRRGAAAGCCWSSSWRSALPRCWVTAGCARLRRLRLPHLSPWPRRKLPRPAAASAAMAASIARR